MAKTASRLCIPVVCGQSKNANPFRGLRTTCTCIYHLYLECTDAACRVLMFLIPRQGIPGCIPWGVSITFLNDYLATDKGLGVFPSTCVLTLYGVGGIIGVQERDMDQIWLIEAAVCSPRLMRVISFPVCVV